MFKQKVKNQEKIDKGPKWYQFKIEDALKKVNSSRLGLTDQDVKNRLEKFGPNKLPEKKKLGALTVFLNQFKSAFVYILLAAAGVSFFLNESIDASVILLAVLINVVVGFFQERKAQKALEALQKVVTTHTRVKRNARVEIITAEELVPGDIVLLQPGDKVPADLRLFEIKDLEIAEATLTGESAPVKKQTRVLSSELVLGDQTNIAFMSTSVTQGTGIGVVVGIGSTTAIGHIASLVRETREAATPLQMKLNKFSKKLALLVLGLSLIIFVVGLSFQHSFGEMFTTAVAVAVAAIPEGLVVAVTMILAVGMRRILKENGLVKKLLAAETLGSTSVICSDKTGTLTQGEMRVAQIVGESEAWQQNKAINTAESAEYGLILQIAVLCNNAFFISSPLTREGSWPLTGRTTEGSEVDKTSPKFSSSQEENALARRGVNINGTPTEKALLLAGWQAGLEKQELEKQHPRLDEIPFDSDKKYMMTLHKFSKSENIIYLKGASEIVLEMSNQVYHYKKSSLHTGHEYLSLTNKFRLKEKKQYEKMSASGLRVLSVAYKKVPASVKIFKDLPLLNPPLIKEGTKGGFVFVGFIGLQDTLRPDTRETVISSRKSGVTTVMITGDHKLTAQAIAKDLGLKHESKNILTGQELDKMKESQLKKLAPQISVYARVTPEHKLKIIKAWQDLGKVVAMTGDGVNDAPALKKADIGVAIGSGTDVAKETADLILLDNDFKTIVSAIKQGRVIYDNVKKVILYFLSDSFTEMIIIVFGLAFGWPLPVLASQILWVNIVDDTFPALALTQDPEEKEVMSEPPENRSQPILDYERRFLIVLISIITAIDTMALFWFYWQGDAANLAHARTIAFVTLGVDSLLYIFSVRTLRRPIWRMNLFANKFLIYAVIIGLGIQIIAVYMPFLHKILRTVPLSLFDWAVILAVSLAVIVIIEAVKWLFIVRVKKRVI